MGQGGYIDVVNATTEKLALGHYHSYQMEAWDGHLPRNIEALSASWFYVEWSENIFHAKSDDAAEAQYGDGARTIFEIQARWQHLQVKCLESDSNFVIGVLKKSNFTGKAIPSWHPLKENEVYDLGWNHDGHMTIALVDLRLLFNGSDLEHFRESVQNSKLTSNEQGKLYALVRVWSGYRTVKWDNKVLNLEYEHPILPEGRQVDIAVEYNIDIAKGVKTKHEFKKEAKISSTFEYYFTETLSLGYIITFKGGIPFAACTESELSISLALEAGQKWSETKEETYSINDTVELEGPGKYNIRGYVDYEDGLRVPFTSRCNISAESDGYKVPANMLAQLLQNKKYGRGFTGKIVETNPYTVIATIDGYFIGSYGVKSHLVVTNAETGEIIMRRSY